jgi:hypothetical protein
LETAACRDAGDGVNPVSTGGSGLVSAKTLISLLMVCGNSAKFLPSLDIPQFFFRDSNY